MNYRVGGHSGFYAHPDNGPSHTYGYSFGSFGIENFEHEEWEVPEHYTSFLLDYRSAYEVIVRIRAAAFAAPESASTMHFTATGIHNMTSYTKNSAVQGHTALSCGLTLPIEYHEKMRATETGQGRPVATALAHIIYDSALKLAQGEQGPWPEEDQEAMYEMTGPFGLTLSGISRFHSTATMQERLVEVAQHHTLDLQREVDKLRP